jgi:hypothetical protein
MCYHLEWAKLAGPSQFIEVPSFTLDALVEKENLQKVDVIKIDAEGHKLSVLQESRDIITKFRSAIMLENNRLFWVPGDTANFIGVKGGGAHTAGATD